MCSPTKASIPGPMVDIGVLSTETDADLTRCTTSFMAETTERIDDFFVVLKLLWRHERKINRVTITDEKMGGIVGVWVDRKNMSDLMVPLVLCHV